jgi:hypothetical protein
MYTSKLKEIREALGLSMVWVAFVEDVHAEEVFAWETGRKPVPDKLLLMLETLEDRFVALTSLAIEQYMAEPSEVVAYLRYYNDTDLWRYMPEFRPLPASCHRALIQRIVTALTETGAKAYAVYMLPIRYEAWRVENGLPDCDETRSIWALKLASELPEAEECNRGKSLT